MRKRDYKELIGKKINYLTILGLGKRIQCGPYRTVGTLRCKCECGKIREIQVSKVLGQIVKSCGCQWLPSRISHDLTHHPLYATWQGMKRRCDDPNNIGYKNYGGRGIKVCRRWINSFENFLKDVGERPAPGLTIDRINNDKGYYPNNVRWATRQQQAANKRPKSKSNEKIR